jgi:arylsulfatase A-like enzyme
MTTPPLLLMVSLDGLRADALDDPTLPLPTLRALAARGARARVRPVFPTVTWTCHTSIVTGVTAARHGVLGNSCFDRAVDAALEHYGDRTDCPVAVPTLWDRVAAAGERAAALCWPKTRGSKTLTDQIPECFEQALFETGSSRPLWEELGAAGLPLDRYAEWSEARLLAPMQDWLTVEATAHVLATRPPRLLLVHLLTLDQFQHEFGVGSPESRWALAHVDALLGRLLDTLDRLGRRDATTVMAFGDHGFVPIETRHHANLVLHEAGLVELDARGAVRRRRAWVAANGGSAFVYVLDGAPRTTRDRLRERFAALPGVQAVGPEAFGELGLPSPDAHPAQGDLVLLADAGVMLTGHATPEAAAAGKVYRGNHGHAPAVPGLAAGLVMAGPGVREGVDLGEVAMLDLAPTAAHLCGVTLPDADGRPIQVALADGARPGRPARR